MTEGRRLDPKRPREPKRPRPITEEWLERAALHYLGRFSASEARLREVLAEKVRRRGQDRTLPTDLQDGWIMAVVAKCVRLGYVDDAAFALQRAESQLRRGKTHRMIARDLAHKGVADEHAQAALAALEEAHGGDGRALLNYARRRRFGPYAQASLNPKPEEKQVAALMRAGFRYEHAQMVVSAKSVEELEEKLLDL